MTAPVALQVGSPDAGATRTTGARTRDADPVRVVSSQSLLDGARELVIHHQGGQYHLRLTRNDKLILTK